MLGVHIANLFTVKVLIRNKYNKIFHLFEYFNSIELLKKVDRGKSDHKLHVIDHKLHVISESSSL